MINVLLAVLLQAAAAEKPAPLPWRGVEIKLGGYLAAVDSKLDVEGENGIGASFDAEDVLGLDSSVISWRLGASVALGARHRLHFDMFALIRSASQQLGRDVDFDGTTYPIGTEVDTRLAFQIYNLTYGYSLMQDERVDLAVTFGIHGVRTGMKLNSSASGMQEEENFFIPIPLPGFRFDVALTQKLWLRQRLELLWLGGSKYQGLLTDYNIDVEYALFDHVALGIGYNSTRIKLKSENDSIPGFTIRGELDFQFSGLQFYVNVFF